MKSRILFRPDDPAGSGGAAPAGSPAAPAAAPPADPPAPGKTFTQEDVDKLIAARVKRAEAEARKSVEDEAKKAAMSAEDKLKAELESAKQDSQKVVERANRMLVQAKAESVAAALGATGENAEAVIKLADLSAIEVNEDGSVDLAAITAAITQVKGKFGALFTPAGTQRSGGDMNAQGNGKRVYTEAQIAAMTASEFAEVADDINAAAAEPGRPRLRSA